ncbi:hypothetical protein MML48_1g12226 [Holotrichia oblita]|uniref:Uncharacterized protein n=1 Tax=Holotrichia oblita TaxID=644536 RepID=A0ACB9TZ04_HOLOL|nr:hypothetical protein MML48_1g12226 [Holotrichia oblita]
MVLQQIHELVVGFSISDFFLWANIKNEVYRKVPTTAENIQERIRAAFRAVSLEVLRAVSRACESNLRLFQQEGRHFEHLD